MIKIRDLIIGFIFITKAVPAWALCVAPTISNLTATSTFSGASGEYSVFDPTEYMQNVTFDVNATASLAACRYFLVLSTGSSGNAAQRMMTRTATSLNYNAYTNASKTIITSSGSYNASGTISGMFPFIGGLQSNNHTLYWTIAPSQVVTASATRFQDGPLSLQLWAELALGIYTNTDNKPITFRAKAESQVDLSLVDSGGGFNTSDNTQTVDFGTLASSSMQSYDTMVRSNDGYHVTFQSNNSQVLRHTNYPTVATTVPYTVTFNGGMLNLAGGGAVTAISGMGTTATTGDRYQTRFTVGTLSGSEPAGDYQDVISVTLSAN